MKLFEIGDGLKSIKVSANYYSERENENTIILYDPEQDFFTGRISVITVAPKDDADQTSMFRSIIEEGKKKGYKVECVDDKSYYTYTQQLTSEGEEIRFFVFEIGYCNNIIVITITVPSAFAQNNEEAVENILDDITQFIPSIEEISLASATIFSPQYSDLVSINERLTSILNIREGEIDSFHENDRTISFIQDAIDKNKFSPTQTHELQSLGIALGDYIQYKDSDFHWAVTVDEYGRDICLQYKKLAISIFPATMISKRIEDDEKVVISDLISGIKNQIINLEKSGDYTLLDYNDN